MTDRLFAMNSTRWDGPWVARPINSDSAQEWIAAYHYLGKRNSSATEFGVFCPDMIAVVSIGIPANPHGVRQKFQLWRWEGNREIQRVAVHPDSPKNSASRAVACVLAEVARWGLRWTFSYADAGQGHHGGIYQALNAVYLGSSGARHGFLLNGEPLHPRSVVTRYGTQAREEAPKIAARRGEDLVYVENMLTVKHLYVLPMGDRRTRSEIRRHLARWAKPYPKRDGAGGVVETAGAAASDSRFDPDPPLNNRRRVDDGRQSVLAFAEDAL